MAGVRACTCEFVLRAWNCACANEAEDVCTHKPWPRVRARPRQHVRAACVRACAPCRGAIGACAPAAMARARTRLAPRRVPAAPTRTAPLSSAAGRAQTQTREGRSVETARIPARECNGAKKRAIMKTCMRRR
eukprot:4646654-Pleurochrysis_carterae.AAC.1